MKKIAILQSNYLPWLGYFQIINLVDEFIIYDSVQYTKNDWRNRNQIKTPYGLKWLSIPVKKNNLLKKSIDEVEIVQQDWVDDHINKIKENYKSALFFEETFSWLLKIFEECKKKRHLSEINMLFIKETCIVLGIETRIVNCREFQFNGDKNEKLLDICYATDADIYLSGPAAKSYLNEDIFKKAGIEIEWMNYNLDFKYPQLYGEFTYNVSVIDLLFNVGFEDAKKYLNNN